MMSSKGIEMKKIYYIYKLLCKDIGKFLESDEKIFICEMDCKKNNKLFEEYNENLLIKVLKRTKIIAALKGSMTMKSSKNLYYINNLFCYFFSK